MLPSTTTMVQVTSNYLKYSNSRSNATSPQNQFATSKTIVYSVSLLAILTCILVGVVTTVNRQTPNQPLSSSTNTPLYWPYLAESSPEMERFKKLKGLQRGRIEGASDWDEFFWQWPDEDTTNNYRGVLFAAHGCSHSKTDWWPRDERTCPECIGLAEELAIADMVSNEFQLLLVVMSSIDRTRKCWSGFDGPRVAKVLHDIKQSFGGPILAFGASSGGAFVSQVLPFAMAKTGVALDGYISQISAPRVPSDESSPPLKRDTPAVFITMDRDRGTDRNAAAAVDYLQSRNKVPATQIRVPPQPVTEEFFWVRLFRSNPADRPKAKQMVEALQNAHMLDAESHLLLEDPRRSEWRSVLAPVMEDHADMLEADKSPLSELMNVAWGKHEMTRDGVREAIAFLLQHTSSNGNATN